ncbi:MAG: efflux RND transporter periplasmic adaptor subunit [Acaryochloridaceae cyanobacterium SU_2_1]|nr:efflux RND transporter periplasmic adaptor subunit [Acaryochloridaceae cyanobacterium SU_2_1]
MSSHNSEPITDVSAENQTDPPALSHNAVEASSAPSGKHQWILPTLLGVLVVGGVGWVGLNRIVLPLLMSRPQGAPPSIPVPVAAVRTTIVEDSSDYAASLDSRQSIIVKPKVSGRIAAILVRAGDRVQAGDRLFQIDADQQQAQILSRKAGVETAVAEVNTAEADVNSAENMLASFQARQTAAEANVQLNQSDYLRFQKLYKSGATSKQILEQKRNGILTAQAELNQAKADVQAQKAAIARAKAQVNRDQQAVIEAKTNVLEGQVQLQDYAVTAPFAGIVGDIPAKLGDLVDSATPLLTLSENDQLEVQLQIPLDQSAALRQGKTVKLLDDKGKTLRSGQISFISPNVDPATQSVLAKARFANIGNVLRSSQFVKARVVWSTRSGLLVPTTAISRLGGKDFCVCGNPLSEVWL